MYQEQYRALIPRAREVTAGLSAGQLNWRPDEASWSIAECLAHLNATNEKYADAIGKAIDRARREGWMAKGEPRLGFVERWVLSLMEPPVKRKFKAPGAFAPSASAYDRDELLARWTATHERLIELARASEGLDLKRARVPSPATPLIRFSLLWALLAMPAHDRRHLWQIEQIRAKMPAALSRSAE